MYNFSNQRKILAAMLFIVFTAWWPTEAHASAIAQAQEPGDESVRILVKVDPTAVDQDEIGVLSEKPSSQDSLAQVGWEVVEVATADAPQIIAELGATPGILEVTPDYPLELAWKPNDPGFAQGTQWAIEKIGADVAWEFSLGQQITVAVIDSGVDPNHPELVSRLVPGYNFVDKDSNTADECGHGTHVAGIIAAETNNAVGVAGIANQAKIMPIKVIGDTCSGSYSRLMQGIIFAVDQGVRIITITSGGGYDHSGLHDAIVYARSKGVLIAIAAGNRGNSLPFYPGSYLEGFTVSGTDENDASYNMSNYGEQIDLSAPAVAVYSTFWDKEKGSSYSYMTGTSMAAPHVAAVAALILSLDPKLPLEDLESALINSAADLGNAGWDPNFGWGRLTAWRAVAAVSPSGGNVRVGHYRVPNMETFSLTDVTVSANVDSIELSWAQSTFDNDSTVVIYRSDVPVFEAALDVAEIPAVAVGIYVDTNVEPDQEYYYWLIEAENDVEVAITDSYNAMLASAPAAPEDPQKPQPEEPQQPEPEEPSNPQQPKAVAMFMPFLEK